MLYKLPTGLDRVEYTERLESISKAEKGYSAHLCLTKEKGNCLRKVISLPGQFTASTVSIGPWSII